MEMVPVILLFKATLPGLFFFNKIKSNKIKVSRRANQFVFILLVEARNALRLPLSEVSVGAFKYEQNEIPHTLSGLSSRKPIKK